MTMARHPDPVRKELLRRVGRRRRAIIFLGVVAGNVLRVQLTPGDVWLWGVARSEAIVNCVPYTYSTRKPSQDLPRMSFGPTNLQAVHSLRTENHCGTAHCSFACLQAVLCLLYAPGGSYGLRWVKRPQ